VSTSRNISYRLSSLQCRGTPNLLPFLSGEHPIDMYDDEERGEYENLDAARKEAREAARASRVRLPHRTLRDDPEISCVATSTAGDVGRNPQYR
jgi:hypothetical protein